MSTNLLEDSGEILVYLVLIVLALSLFFRIWIP